jgi:hypothetical protein
MTRLFLLAWVATFVGCAGAASPPPPPRAPEPRAEVIESDSERASSVEDSAPSGYCYVFARTAPPARFSNCYASESACRAGVATNAANFADQGGTLEVDCALSPSPFCAVAVDGVGDITFRSCAWNAEVCEEQRRRAVDMIHRGMIAGAEPACRAATEEDLTRTGRRAAETIGPMH